MNIKTFRAASLREGLRLVHEEFGEDAKILHAREFDEPCLFGLRRRHFVEITATEGMPEPAGRASQAPTSETDPFLRQLEQSPYETAGSVPRIRPETAKPEKRKETFKTVPQGLWPRLTAQQLNPSVLQRNLIARLDEFVPFAGPLDLPGDRRNTVALVGPTGVGKTSTLIKLASHYNRKELKRVGLVSVDMQRLAATEQILKFAEILDVPLETVSEPYRMKTALGRLKDRDLVLIDTPGIVPKDAANLRRIRDFLDAATVEETLLVLPATSSTPVLLDAMRRFESIDTTALILTKFDEAVGPADLYRFLKENSLPLRFFAAGPRIPEDLEVAGAARLAGLA